MTLANFWQKNKGFFVPPVIALATLAIFWHNWHTQYVADVAPAPVPPNLSEAEKEIALCNKMVPLLLHSTDVVEVTRAGMLVQHLNCGIGKRLP
jgi:hypothetical protein